MLCKFVQLPIWNSQATLVNCKLRKSCINARIPKYGYFVPSKSTGSQFPHIMSQIPGEQSQVEGSGSRVPCMGSGSRVSGPGSHFSGMPLKPLALLKKKPAQVFSYEFCESFNNSFFQNTSGGCTCSNMSL